MSLILHENSPRTPVKTTDFHQFVVDFSRDPKYIDIRTTAANQVAANRLETFLISEKEEWETIMNLWNFVIASVPNFQPSTDDISRWNILCEQYAIPLRFNSDETLSLLAGET